MRFYAAGAPVDGVGRAIRTPELCQGADRSGLFCDECQVNRQELLETLERLDIDANAFSLGGGHPVEKYCLSPEARGQWSAYYSERGLRTGLKFFSSEDEACRYLLQWMLDDPTTRRR